jgi:hypothetical protein
VGAKQACSALLRRRTKLYLICDLPLSAGHRRIDKLSACKLSSSIAACSIETSMLSWAVEFKSSQKLPPNSDSISPDDISIAAKPICSSVGLTSSGRRSSWGRRQPFCLSHEAGT